MLEVFVFQLCVSGVVMCACDEFPETGVTGRSEPPDVAAGNQI